MSDNRKKKPEDYHAPSSKASLDEIQSELMGSNSPPPSQKKQLEKKDNSHQHFISKNNILIVCIFIFLMTITMMAFFYILLKYYTEDRIIAMSNVEKKIENLEFIIEKNIEKENTTISAIKNIEIELGQIRKIVNSLNKNLDDYIQEKDSQVKKLEGTRSMDEKITSPIYP